MTDVKWQDALENDTLKTSPVLATFKTPEDAFQGLIELKSYVGKSIALPPEDATPEMWTEFDGKLTAKVPGLVRKPTADSPEDAKRFWGDLGVPGEESGYTPPEDLELPEEMVKDLTSIAFASGLTQEQYATYLKTYATAHGEQMTAIATAQEQEKADLKKLWGGAYEDNIKITDAIAEKFAGKDMPLEGLNNAARVAFLNIANSVTSDPQIFNQVQTVTTKKTPAEIESRVEDIRSLLMSNSVKGDKRKQLLIEQGKLYEELEQYR